MPTLVMPPNSFNSEDEVKLVTIYENNRKLIDSIKGEAEVWVIGRKDDDTGFWEDTVLNKENNEVLDPLIKNHVTDLSSISHFCFVSLVKKDGVELYFGNPNYELSKFVREVLIQVNVILKSLLRSDRIK